LRKSLIAAAVAVTAVAVTGVAVAQQPAAPSLSVNVTPTDAGTTKNPKNERLRLRVNNPDATATLSRLTITAPSTVKLSTRGFPRCSESVLANRGPSGCPRASRVGTGIARALLGVNTATPSPLTFDVTAVVTGSGKLGFYLDTRELPVNVLAPATISGRNLVLTVPNTAQQPVPGTWAGLVSIDTTIGAKRGNRYIVSSTGCKNRRHKFSAAFTFVNNGVNPGGTQTAQGSARCTK
jgi:hypothetical protein